MLFAVGAMDPLEGFVPLEVEDKQIVFDAPDKETAELMAESLFGEMATVQAVVTN